MVQGIVGNIQKYSIHDGPGIRSTLFIKGCPLVCAWCHNPESIPFNVQTSLQKDKCIGCGDCLAACPPKALTATTNGIIRDETACNHCGKCAEVCPTLAWELHGRKREAAEVVADLLKDRPFYESSGGGVTLSGGEPLSQPEFSLEVLRLLKQEDIHTTVDTCGQAPWEVLEKFIPLTDLFLYDIKHLDTAKHLQYTGVGNELILSNLEKLAQSKAEIWLRLPLIPSINDDKQHLTDLANLIKTLRIKRLYLLPYHNLAENKYKNLGLTYTLNNIEPPGAEHMQQIKQFLQEQQVEVVN